MTAIFLQIVNFCVLGMGFYQFLRESHGVIKKVSNWLKGIFVNKNLVTCIN